MTNRLRAIALASLVLMGALLLTACGSSKKKDSSSGSNAGDATSLLKDTFSGGHKIKSGKLSVDVAVTLQGASGVPGPIGVKLSGPFDSTTPKELPKFDLDLALSLGAQGAFNAGAASDGNGLVVKLKDQAYALPDNVFAQLKSGYAQQQQQSSSASSKGLSALGIDPLKLIKNATIAGDQDVGGEATTHISADVDPAGLVDAINSALSKAGSLGLGAQTSALPKSLPSNIQSQIKAAIKSAKIDVFSGKADHTLREFDITLAIAPPGSSSGPKEIDLKLKVQLTDVNQPQTITLPSDTKPFAQLQQQLGGLLSGLGGLGGGAGLGSTGGSSSTSTTGSAGAQKAVQACVSKFATDQSKLSQCLAHAAR